MTGITEAVSGELLTPTDRDDRTHVWPATPNLPDPPARAPVPTAIKPSVDLGALDAAIAARRTAITGLNKQIAFFEEVLARPAGGRLAALLSGKDDSRVAAEAKRAATCLARDAADVELRELLEAKRPHEAIAANFEYDRTIRPKLVSALCALDSHLRAAASVLVESVALQREADTACLGSMARSLAADRAGAPVVEIDRRELDLLRRWLPILTGQGGRLNRWSEELRMAGVDLTTIGGR